MKQLIAGFIELKTVEGKTVLIRYDAIELIAELPDGTTEIVTDAGSRVHISEGKGLLNVIEACRNHQQSRDIQAAETAAIRAKGAPLVSRSSLVR